MTSWIEPLIDSTALVRDAQRVEEPDERTGLALLLEARLLMYRRLAVDSGWPAIGDAVSRRATARQRLLSAVGLHLLGDTRARDEYRTVLQSREPGLATAATVLLALLDRDLGYTDDAIRALRKRLKGASDTTEQILLHLHIGARLAEAGDWTGAASQTENAIGIGSRSHDTPWRVELEIVAEHNLFQFNWQRQMVPRDPLSLRSRTTHSALIRSDLLIGGALTDYLRDQFDAALADPYTRTVRFRAEDETEGRLQGALLRSECLADWERVKLARALLGRYQVISRIGTRLSVPASALELLRRAGDTKGLRAAARTIARMGPMASLQSATSALLEQPSLGDERDASLILLAEGADLLSAKDADRAAAKLVRDPEMFVEAWDESAKALAEVAKVASTETQTVIARFARELLSDPIHSGLVQSLQRVVAGTRWDEVEADERKRWLRIARSAFASGTDTHFVAVRILGEFSHVERAAVESFLVTRFREGPTLEVLALMLDALRGVPRWAEKQADDLVVESLRTTRSEAHEGSYGLGTVDVGSLAIGLLRQRPRTMEVWHELVEVLIDPRVGMGTKVRPLDLLAAGVVPMPRDIRDRLTEVVPTLNAVDEEWSTLPEAFEGSIIRLVGRLQRYPREELLARLLDLATRSTAYGRIQAAHSLPFVQRRVGFDVSVTLALTLSRDVHHDVRAAAARALPQLAAPEGNSALAEMKRGRLRDLLDDPGTVVPHGVTAGFIEAARADLSIGEEFVMDVRRLERRHASHVVRSAARLFLDTVEGAAPGDRDLGVSPKPLPGKPGSLGSQ